MDIQHVKCYYARPTAKLKKNRPHHQIRHGMSSKERSRDTAVGH